MFGEKKKSEVDESRMPGQMGKTGRQWPYSMFLLQAKCPGGASSLLTRALAQVSVAVRPDEEVCRSSSAGHVRRDGLRRRSAIGVGSATGQAWSSRLHCATVFVRFCRQSFSKDFGSFGATRAGLGLARSIATPWSACSGKRLSILTFFTHIVQIRPERTIYTALLCEMPGQQGDHLRNSTLCSAG